MKPGRELDALVHEKIILKLAEENPEAFAGLRDVNGYLVREDLIASQLKSICPPYSTDIAAAWLVAQKIADISDDNDFVIHLSPTKFNECDVEVRYWNDGDAAGPVLAGPFFIHGETAPHAICLAALKVVGAL